MNARATIVILAIAVLVLLGWWYLPVAPEQVLEDMVPDNVLPVANWFYTEPNAQGIQFQYPRDLGTTYISTSTEGWPPEVTLISSEFACEGRQIAHDGDGAPMYYIRRMIGDREYCVVEGGEGAAGSTYRTYWYTTQQGDFLASVTFTLRFPQCANYDEPERGICIEEQSGFDVDSFADRILSSIRML